VRVKRIVKLAADLTAEEFDLLQQLRKLGMSSADAKPRRRKYARKAAKAEGEPRKREAKAKGDGGDIDLKFPKPGKRGPGRPRKVHSMIPAPEAVVAPEV